MRAVGTPSQVKHRRHSNIRRAVGTLPMKPGFRRTMVSGPYLTARMVSSHGLWYRACVPSGTQSWDLGPWTLDLGPWTFPKDRASSTTKVGRNIGNAHQTPQLNLWPHSGTFKPWTLDLGPWTKASSGNFFAKAKPI